MKSTSDLGAGLCFMTLGLGALALSREFGAGAGAFPAAVAGVMIVLAAVLVVRWLAGRGRNPAGALAPHGRRFALTLGITLAYVIALDVIGFFTTSALFVPALAAALGFRRPGYLLAATGIFVALLYALFALLLQRPLPTEFFLAH